MSYTSVRRKPLPDDYIQQHELIGKHGPSTGQHSRHVRALSSKNDVLRRWQAVLTNTWLLEHACLVIRCALLTAIIILASYYNDRSITEWTAALSFNTILAVLATVMKGALVLPTASALGQLKRLDARSRQTLNAFKLYDDASRGPMGALKLLLRLRWAHMATLGAIILVTALATDAFVQASVSIKTRIVEKAGTAATSVCHNYTLYSLNTITSGTQQEMLVVAEPSVEGAVYAAILDIIDNPSALYVIPTCSTGNCAFGIYSSLGVRSDCQDLTDSMSSTSDNDTGVTTMSLVVPEQQPLTLRLGPYETPYINLSTPQNDTSGFAINEEVANQTVQLFDLYGIGSWSANLSYNPADTSLGSFEWRAFYCHLDLIVETHNTSVVAGETRDQILNTSDEFFCNGSYIYSRPGLGDAIGITEWALLGVQGLLFTLLEGSGVSISQVGPNGTLSYPTETWTNNAVQGIWNNGIPNINVTSQGIATALTNNMMKKSNQTMTGSTFSQQSYFKSRLGFLTQPILLTILAVAFVVSTVMKSNRARVPIWKTNVLATVVYARDIKEGVDDDALVPAHLETASDLESWARGKAIILPPA